MSGTFPAKGYSERVGSKTYASVLLDAQVEPSMVVGSLGIRADVGRPHEASVWLQLALGPRTLESHVLTAVDYLDEKEPVFDQGEGMFWPYDDTGAQPASFCGWLDVPEGQRDAMSLDDYNAQTP